MGFCAALVAEWCDRGLTDAVLCPGSRNTPITLALSAEPRMRVHVVLDERAAGFLALGFARATGRPAVLTCTSGSAPAHFHPAVLEADLAAVPMLVLTADRPPELQGVLAPQTTIQRDLYGGAVRWYCEPGPPAAGSEPWWADLAHDALGRSCGERPGPVHLNLAFREPLVPTGWSVSTVHDSRDEPLRSPVRSTQDDVAQAATGNPWQLTDEDLARMAPLISARRGVVVAGDRTARTGHERDAVIGFAETLGWPLFADAASGVRVPAEPVVAHFDSVLRSGRFDASPPEVVLRLGALVTSRNLANWLATSGATQFAFDRYGLCPDPDHVLTRDFPVSPPDALGSLLACRPEPAPGTWSSQWARADAVASDALRAAMAPRGTDPVSEPVVARTVLASLAPGAQMLVASSMPVRDLECFAEPRDGVTVYSNRGTNGIDGMISSATGIALGSRAPTVLLCGDLAYLHDIGMLANRATRTAELTIVVIDNDGGGIFHFLDQARELDQVRFETYFGTPHGLDLVAVTAGYGVEVERLRSRAGLAAALAGASRRRGLRVLVVESQRRRNVEVHRELNDAVANGLGVSGEPRVSP